MVLYNILFFFFFFFLLFSNVFKKNVFFGRIRTMYEVIFLLSFLFHARKADPALARNPPSFLLKLRNSVHGCKSLITPDYTFKSLVYVAETPTRGYSTTCTIGSQSPLKTVYMLYRSGTGELLTPCSIPSRSDRFLWEQKVAKKVKVFWQLLVRNFGQ